MSAPALAMATWGALGLDARRALGAGHDVQEVRWLLEEVSGLAWPQLRSRLHEPPPPAAAAALAALVTRRLAGEPLQHVLGHWSFRGLDLLVDRRALVPRPETEVVVEVALRELDRRPHDGPGVPGGAAAGGWRWSALDLGTGSGAIACSLVAERDGLEVLAVDRSAEALALALANRERLGAAAAARLRLLRADWYGPIAPVRRARFDLVVANPPYLAAGELAGLEPVVRDHDPHAALVAGPDGLEAVRAVVGGAPAVLAPGGSLVVEIAPAQSRDALELAGQAGAGFAAVEPDLAGRDRVLVARW